MFGCGSVSTLVAPTTAVAAAIACLRLRLGVDGCRIAALVAHSRGHVEHRRRAGDDAAHPLLDQALHRGVERAHGAAQHDFLRDDVPGVAAVDLRDADHTGVERMEVARDDGLQRADRVRDEQHRVLAGVGHRRVRALAGRDDLEDVERAHERSRAHREGARRLLRPVVHPVDRAHRKPVEEPFRDHHATAAFVLLGRLEDEIERPVEVLAPGERGGRAQQHRRVPVVPARVHLARDRRRMRDARLLVDVQRVEVRAQADRLGPGSADAARRRRRSSRAPCARRGRTSAACRRRTPPSPLSSKAVSGWA